MEKFQNKYRIESHRWKGWNYAQNGAYFVTLVTHNREPLFGEIVDGKMILNEIGEIVHSEFLKSFEIRNELYLGEYVIMPNHIHAIVVLDNDFETVMETHGGKNVETQCGKNVETQCGKNVETQCGKNVETHGGKNVETHGGKNVETHGRASLQRAPKSISSFLAGFKSSSINRVDDWIDGIGDAQCHMNPLRKKFNKQNPMWQANYHDHIIRNELEYRQIVEYIINNPVKWSDTDTHGQNIWVDAHGGNLINLI